MKRAVSAWLLSRCGRLARHWWSGCARFGFRLRRYRDRAHHHRARHDPADRPRQRDAAAAHSAKPILANGAVGEFFPIIAITVFLGTTGRFVALITLGLFAVLAVLVLWVPRNAVPRRVSRIVAGGTEATSQSTLRWVIVLLIGSAAHRQPTRTRRHSWRIRRGNRASAVATERHRALEHKLDAVGYGFFIPIYFIVSGMNLDLNSILSNPERCVLFFVLLLVVRGGSVFVLPRIVSPCANGRSSHCSAATALPLLVALSQIGMDTGEMRPANAAALVGAGVLSVLVFPLVATKLNRKQEPQEVQRTLASVVRDGVTANRPWCRGSVRRPRRWCAG